MIWMDPVGKTDMGRLRVNNEDSLFVSGAKFHALPNLFIVADGMGGHNAGEIASVEAINKFKEYSAATPLKKNEILDYIVAGCVYANDGVYDLSRANYSYSGMGTTFSLCVLAKKRLYISHIGDSRIYAVYKDKIRLLTADHTYVFEMQKLGQITEEQAKTHPKRNVLIKVLGVERGVKFDGFVYEIDCEKILLCSDGLTNMLSDDEILSNMHGTNTEIADRLISNANQNGGADNITLILFDVTEVFKNASGAGRHNKRPL